MSHYHNKVRTLGRRSKDKLKLPTSTCPAMTLNFTRCMSAIIIIYLNLTRYCPLICNNS